MVYIESDTEHSFRVDNVPTIPVVTSMDEDTSSVPVEKEPPIPPSHSVGGRPTSNQQAALDLGFQKINSVLDDLADETGKSQDNILKFNKHFTGINQRRRNSWNEYQRYANDSQFALGERMRIDPDFQLGDDGIVPQMDPQTATEAFKLFKQAHPNWSDILGTYAQMVSLGASETIASRQRQFENNVTVLTKRVSFF
jgi:hypothetical protein